tara:strand:- start:409 stop:801 length:393 start_codon:yes stop_codon:yes gene_type:complete
MELDMKKDIKSTDKISEGTLHEILLDIKYRLEHLEDIEADNRALIVKMIKQGNSIVKFLAQIDLEADEHIEMEDMKLPSIHKQGTIESEKMMDLKELIDEFMEKRKDLQELEKELKKYKDEITPGQVGES